MALLAHSKVASAWRAERLRRCARNASCACTNWYFAAFSFDPDCNSITLCTDMLRRSAFDAGREVTEAAVATAISPGIGLLLLGAGSLIEAAGRALAQDCFNGKLSSPQILADALPRNTFEKKSTNELMNATGADCEARWDFAADPGFRQIRDITGHGNDAVAVNRPTRAVTGHNWTAVTDSFHEAPEQYNAIHFHDDDLEDAGWSESFRYTVPQSLRSGVYAIRIGTEDGIADFLPFFVRPKTGSPEAPIAVLIPTLSYLAYSNESLDLEPFEFLSALCPLRNMTLQPEEYAYIQALNLKSTYDSHRDGSGICHVTMLRPSLTSMRPSHRCRMFDGPHQLSADLHLIDWLEAKGISYDVITDHDLHREGAPLLKPYRAILTGTHAEYWSTQMLDGLDGYQQAGGRFIYLSGNGLYWVTALDPETQTVCEIRRTNGTRAWQAKPGEGRLSFTGEPGGIWAWRGRAPQKYVGVGFAAQGFDRGAAYRRTQASHDPRCAFLFEGIDSQLLGDFPVLVMNYGAAGYEVDRAEPGWGTPAHALVVATSLKLSDSYQFVVEDIPASMPSQGGLTNANVRADMVFYETPNGGAVFSTGSISFCSALSYNTYQNDISRLLENVIRAFSAESLPGKNPNSPARQ